MIVFIAAIQLVLPVALTVADGYLEALGARECRCLAHRGAWNAALSARSPGRHLRDLSFPFARGRCKAGRSACSACHRTNSFFRFKRGARCCNTCDPRSNPPLAPHRPPDHRSSRDKFARPRITIQNTSLSVRHDRVARGFVHHGQIEGWTCIRHSSLTTAWVGVLSTLTVASFTPIHHWRPRRAALGSSQLGYFRNSHRQRERPTTPKRRGERFTGNAGRLQRVN